MKHFFIISLLVISSVFFYSTAQAAYGDVTTFLGKVYDGDGGEAVEAWLDFPEDLEFDSSGNTYVADTGNNVIRKIDNSGNISTYAGSGHYGFYNAAGTLAEFAAPRGLAFDSGGNLYIADTDNSLIRKVDIYRSVSTVVSGTVNKPEGLAVFGSYLYIADTGNNAVKKLNLSTGRIDILTADVSAPKKLAVNASGSTLYVADSGNFRVVSVDTTSGITTLIAGGTEGYAEGTGSSAQFEHIWGVDVDGFSLYVTDGDGFDDRVRKINISTKTTSLLVQDLRMQVVNYPNGLRVKDDKIYIASTGIGTIRSFDRETGADTDDDHIAGVERFGYRNGSFSEALFGRPSAIVQSPDRTKLYVANNNKIQMVDLVNNQVSLIVGSSVDDYIGEDYIGAAAQFSNISAMAIDPDGSTLYIVDRWNNRIRAVNIEEQSTYLIAGGGDYNTSGPGNGYMEGRGDAARIDNPFGITIDSEGENLYITDVGNKRVRKIVIATGQTSLIAGSGSTAYADGVGSAASFKYPAGITIDEAGDYLYVADRDSHTIRRIRLSDNTVSTVVGVDDSPGYRDGIGNRAILSLPLYVDWGLDGRLYFSEAGSLRIRVLEPANWLTKLVTGSGNRGYHDSSRTEAKFNGLSGIAVDVTGSVIFVADKDNDLIRRVNITGTPPFTDPAPVVQGVTPQILRDQTNPENVAYVDVLGANFLHGVQVTFGDHNTTTYVKSAAALTVVIPIGQMESGWYDVEVRNLDGQRDVLANAFALSDTSGSVPGRSHQIVETDGFLAYSAAFEGGVNLASGDVDGDGQAEIITAPASQGGPHVRIFNYLGEVENQFFAYAPTFRGGITVASCDINSDGKDDVVVGTGPGLAPHVRMLTASGDLLGQFFAYPEHFRIGVSVACGDVNGDGELEIIVSPLARGGPHIRIFNTSGELVGQFFAYPEYFRMGLDVAAGDLDADGTDEIIVAPINRGGPHVRVFNMNGQVQSQFFAYHEALRTGITVQAGDTDGDGKDEIITGTETGSAPHVRIFDGQGNVESQFFGFEQRLRTGVHIGVGDMNNNGSADIAVVPALGRSSIAVYDGQGNPF
ncbi:MAG: FG-GAP-like repeat-containing protein [bacterium]